MRAYYLEGHGPPENLRLREVPEPEPGPREVAVQIDAIGVNYAEILSRRGMYGWAPDLPYILGMEATGRIASVGAEVEGRSVGEPVIVGTQHGCYAERVVVSEARALPALGGFSREENAAFGVNFMTAWVALMEMARLRPSDRVIVTAAAGGVGTAAVNIAKHLGCEVIALAGSDEKLTRVKAIGADLTVNYSHPAFDILLEQAVGERRVDVVLEVVGGEVFRRCFQALGPFGRVVVAGFASMNMSRRKPWTWWRTWRDLPRAKVMKLAKASKGIMATHIGYLLDDERRLRDVWNGLTRFVAEHDIRPVVGATFPFDQMAEAHHLMERRGNVGKIVVGMAGSSS